MAEYIDRQSLLQLLKKLSARYLRVDEAMVEIMKLPAADVAPVRHGKWEVLETYRDGGTAQRCSQCRDLIFFHRTNPKKYCPNCGAKMDEEEQNNGRV